MAGVVAAYVVVWIGAALYVGRLGLEQRRTARRLRALESELNAAGAKERTSQAA